MGIVDEFQDTYGFDFDDFQRGACDALVDGSSVLVAAPTGSGKTVVGEFAAWLASRGSGKTFYTTPIKALSNQKFSDFEAIYGSGRVGLLTGDNSINGNAPIVVMTTEVLRNMIYEDSPDLDSLEYVVLDEVHYLQDRYRGGVWEEILIHLPVDVKTISLSATVSNAEEFAEWLQTLRGRTEVIIEDRRPIEIRHWYFASDELLPMFVAKPNGDLIPNPRAREFERRSRRPQSRPGRGERREREKRARAPRRTEVIERLRSESMLPAIYFLFSRKGCDQALQQCLHDNIRLTTSDERRAIRTYVEERVGELSPNELDVLGYHDWISALVRGVASHHAGLIPPFKETVEKLFLQGLIKVVFATETLALGINMPARSVVLESLMKFTGEKHEQITPGQYTQLSGRAGRRGIDEIGHSVVLWQRFIPFDSISRLASTRTYELQSSFQPSYNMAVNLVRNYDFAEAEHLVNSSFAQFQADRDVVKLERRRESQAAYLASYRERMSCELGDFDEYWELARKLRERVDSHGASDGRAEIGRRLAALRRGDVFDVPEGRRRGRYVAIEVTTVPGEGSAKILALSEDRTVIRLGVMDFRRAPVRRGRVMLPKDLRVKDASSRRKIVRLMDSVDEVPAAEARERSADPEESALADSMERHPCHTCPDVGRHLHYAERAARLEREVSRLDRRIGRQTGTLARRFEKVLGVLEDLGYVDDWQLTDKGEILTRVYNESDLLVVEALDRGLLEELDAPELAAVCSSLVYEARGPESDTVADMPTAKSREVYSELLDLWRWIRRKEDDRGIELTREPDPGFAETAHRWASGWPLENVLEEDAPAGDFVRSTKQLVDLLRQVELVGPIGARVVETVSEAIEGLQRGVVAYSSLDI
ncbi:MAG TPA: DEAD/DEAH box helicase [Actinomycetota bacterium]|nr:DEAD/DEAH box helicase [Actinomycetota bacterium]